MSAINNAVSGFKGFQRWLGENVVGRNGGDDYSSPGDPKQRDFALLGAATGALAGATIGTVTGFNAQSADSIKESWNQHGITHPYLTGYSHNAIPDYDRVCHYEGSGENRHEVCHEELDGWWHRFSPRIRNDNVGTYSSPSFNHTKGWEPLLGGFLGAAGGALVGLGLGIGANALRNAIVKPSAEEAPVELSQAKHNQLADAAGGAVMAGGVLGAGIGAWLGSRAGGIEIAQQQVNSRTWSAPVLVNTKIGEIPRDNYQHNWIGFGFPGNGEGHGMTSVNRDVPQYNGDGTVRMHDVTREFKTGRYGPVMGGILGGVIGAGAGVASGAALGVCLKFVFEKAAATQAEHAKDNKPPTDKAA